MEAINEYRRSFTAFAWALFFGFLADATIDRMLMVAFGAQTIYMLLAFVMYLLGMRDEKENE